MTVAYYSISKIFSTTQCITYNMAISSPGPVRSVLIQGFVIGPTLFVGFINDLPSEVTICPLGLLANDSKSIARVRDATNRQECSMTYLLIRSGPKRII